METYPRVKKEVTMEAPSTCMLSDSIHIHNMKLYSISKVALLYIS